MIVKLLMQVIMVASKLLSSFNLLQNHKLYSLGAIFVFLFHTIAKFAPFGVNAKKNAANPLTIDLSKLAFSIQKLQ